MVATAAVAAKPQPPLELHSGARVGLITVLDAEVTHFHAAAQVMASSLKTQPVPWRVDLILGQALQAPLLALNLVPVPLPPGDALSGLREECFLEANLTKPLSKSCAAPYTALAAAQHLDAIIILGPGLNNSEHADSTRRKDLPDYLRGWCVLTDGRMPGSAPTLLNLTEMLLIASDAQGSGAGAAAVGRAEHQWLDELHPRRQTPSSSPMRRWSSCSRCSPRWCAARRSCCWAA